jgi:DNA-binding beta-propeller fold protein YncE
MPARLGDGPAVYDWFDGPDHSAVSAGWAHHGVAVTDAGDIVSFDAETADVLIFNFNGELIGRWSSGLTEAHGITVVANKDGECLWVADPGQKMRSVSPGRYEAISVGEHGRVVKFSLDGHILLELAVPPIQVYDRERYSPTAVVADGGDGRVWVADGYGQSLVHVFDSEDRHIGVLPGSFDCPHGLLFDRRRPEPELYVADRENGRIQVYSADGEFRRTVGKGQLKRPSAMATSKHLLIVAELEARLAVFNLDDEFVCYLDGDELAPQRSGWPNTVAADGRTVRPELAPGRFNSPHGLAGDANGNIVVAEWLIGGRLIRLRHR